MKIVKGFHLSWTMWDLCLYTPELDVEEHHYFFTRWVMKRFLKQQEENMKKEGVVFSYSGGEPIWLF